jgi:hypothetical protein
MARRPNGRCRPPAMRNRPMPMAHAYRFSRRTRRAPATCRTQIHTVRFPVGRQIKVPTRRPPVSRPTKGHTARFPANPHTRANTRKRLIRIRPRPVADWPHTRTVIRRNSRRRSFGNIQPPVDRTRRMARRLLIRTVYRTVMVRTRSRILPTAATDLLPDTVISHRRRRCAKTIRPR